MNEEALFALALEKKNAAERQALLDQACAGNAQLRAAIEGLLKASADAGSFLEHPPLPLDATVVSSAACRDTAGAAEWIARLSFLKPCEKPDRIGKLVSKAGEYEIIEVVGHGGMGAVLRAFDTKLSRVVAVKVMAPELAANPVAVKRFLREATTAAAVHHEHVVTIHAVDDSHQPPYLVMQFVEGQTLQDKIDREGALELKHILRIGSQAAAGLAAAHKTGLIHRDVKPSNILLENGVERVKISDFGLARAADDVQMTQTGIISGTPQYMSPEQAKGEPIDAKSDLFSLGSVLYSMCTGRPAFRADNPIAVLRRVCDDTPRPIHETNPEIPEWLCEIVEKLMEKNPQQRFQSAQEVADLLAAHLAHEQQPASCPQPPRVTNRPVSASASANDVIAKEARWFWAAGIMSVVASGLVFGAFQPLSTSVPPRVAIWLIGSGLLSLPVGLTIMYAAWQVERRQSLQWAWTAALLSLLPINQFLIFCLPISIWSLVTLRKAQREGLFASKQPLKTSPPPSAWPPPFWLWSTGLFLAVIGMLVFFLRVAFALHLSPVVATMVGLGFFWVTAMCCWSFAIIFHQARFGSGSIASVCISGAGLTLAIVVMFFGFLKTAFGYDTRPIAPYFVGLMLALVVAMAVWFVSAMRAPPNASRHKLSDAKLRHPANRGLFIEHPVFGLVAILMLIVAASVATYMLTSASHRPVSNPNSLKGQMDLVVRAAKDEMSKVEWLRLSLQNPNLVGQLGDPHTKPLLVFLADLPDPTRRELLEHGYLKWPVSSLPPEGRTAIAAVESTFKSEQVGSHRNVMDLQDAHAGFSVVDLPHIKQRVISWFLIWPKERHEWVTVVNSKALDNHPSYFAAHNQRLAELRDLPDTTLPSATPSLAIAPFDAQQANAHQETWAKHLGIPVEIENSIGIKLRLIPAGTFLMGSLTAEKEKRPLDGPQHEVTISRPFYMGIFEVTQAEYRGITGQSPSDFSKGGKAAAKVAGLDTQRFPVENLDWNEANEFCRKLSSLPGEKNAGRVYRLPTEAEWEYACRAGTQTPFHTGSVLTHKRLPRTMLVDTYPPNAFGLHGMHGNVFEWCHDWFGYYPNMPTMDPQGPMTGGERVARGGNYGYLDEYSRSATRDRFPPSTRRGGIGFRMVCSIDSPPLTPEAPLDLPRGVPAPPLATAPFDTQQAKAHQETWAKHLGVPVEFTNSVGMKLRLIPPGTGVSHPTGLSQCTAPLILGTTEVTVGQFRRFVDETSYQTAGEKSGLGGAKVRSKTRTERKADFVWKHPDFAISDDHPVALVTWHDAAAFCDWLSEKEGRTYRLPTSDEWNWAARAGSAARFYFGDAVSDLDAHAWHLGTSGDHTHPTGNKLPNAWGLFDIYGNVWELSYDFERGGKPIDPTQAKGGPHSAERIYFWGGSYNNLPESVAINGYGTSTVGYSHTGFRVAIVGDLKSQTTDVEKTPTSPQSAAPAQTTPEND